MDRKVAGAEIYDEFLNVIETYYGRNRSTVPVSLINSVIEFCLNELKHFTIEDFTFSFHRSNIEVDQYSRLTLGEIKKPLNAWKALKTIIFQCENEIRKQDRESALVASESERFLNESKVIYQQSLSKGEWIGSPFHATVIAPYFLDDFTELQKNEIQLKARRHYAELREKLEENKQLVSPVFYTTENKYFNEFLVKAAIENKISKFK